MLTYMSLEGDSQAVRSAKLKALKEYFKTTEPTAFAMLGSTALAPSNKSRGDMLVVNSHANAKAFAGYTPQQFFEQLTSKGFAKGSFPAVYLMACSVGKQAQDNSIYDNFAKELKRILNMHGIDTKLYAPRGYLAYTVEEKQASGQTYYRVTDMYIETTERKYPLKEGLLLVM